MSTINSTIRRHLTTNSWLQRTLLSNTLSYLKQGSTITIRSNIPNMNLIIQSQWRDDGHISYIQHHLLEKQRNNNNNKEEDNNNSDNQLLLQQQSRQQPLPDIFISRNKNKTTSLGRDEEHVSIYLQEINTKLENDNEEIVCIESNKVSMTTTSSTSSSSSSSEWNRIVQDENNNTNNDNDFYDMITDHNHHSNPLLSSSSLSSYLILYVPEKINLDCTLVGGGGGGSIIIENKIEGDVRLKTTNSSGNICIQKVRGHTIDLECSSNSNISRDDNNKNHNGKKIIENVEDDNSITNIGDKKSKKKKKKHSTIFVSELVESQSLRLVVGDSEQGRIRVKRIHANELNIQVGTDEYLSSSYKHNDSKNNDYIYDEDDNDHLELLLDEDDSGAICDISSLYVNNGDAHVNVRCPAITGGFSNNNSVQKQQQRQAVRIKSHHGHVDVQTSTPMPTIQNVMTRTRLPSVDLGGVNGSCEVWISKPNVDNGTNNSLSANIEDWSSCNVHFDSIVPDSVSLVHTDWGNVNITADRKVESDIRFISPPSLTAHNVNMDTLLLDNNEDGTLADELSRMLNDLDLKEKSKDFNNKNQSQRIHIQTKAFTQRKHDLHHHLCDVQFVDGWIENATSEPESRFDRALHRGHRHSSSGQGKIRLEGAYDQALNTFHQRKIASSKKNNSTGSSDLSFDRPLLAVSTPDHISLETLSWMGNIARRYGLDESRKEKDLGRQATQRQRLLLQDPLTKH